MLLCHIFIKIEQMRIYLKLLPILLIAALSVAWLPTAEKVIASLPRSESRLAQALVQEIRLISGNVLGAELDELLAVSNVQEIIWQLQEQGAADRAVELQALLQHRLEHSAVLSVRPLNVGLSGARLLELDDGLRAVFKTASSDKDNYKHELLLYRFDNLIGTHVVPLTTVRTLAGEEGSVQLYIENSLSGLDILIAKRQQLGLLSDAQYSHVLFSRAITPPASPVIKTLRLLSLESDINNPSNYLLPRRGRQVAIDGGRAFTADVRQFKKSIHHLKKYPDEYQYENSFIINMEENYAEIETMLPYSYLKPYLHETFANYKDIAKNKAHVLGKGKKKPERVMIEALAAEDWQAADRLLKVHEHLIYLETPELLAVARRQKNWQLLRWIRQHDPYLGGAVLEYALSASDYEFAARLTALGVQTRPMFDAMHKNLVDALAKQQGMRTIDWEVIDWEAIDWQAVRAYADPAYRRFKNATTGAMLEHLDTALQSGDLDAADGILRNYANAASEEQRFALINLLNDSAVVKDLQKAEWLTTHAVMQEMLAKPIVDWQHYKELFDRLRGHVFNYAHTPNPDEQQVQARMKIIAFASRLCISPLFASFFDDLNKLFDEILQARHETWVTQGQRVQRLQQVLDIFQASGVEETYLATLRNKLERKMLIPQ